MLTINVDQVQALFYQRALESGLGRIGHQLCYTFLGLAATNKQEQH